MEPHHMTYSEIARALKAMEGDRDKYARLAGLWRRAAIVYRGVHLGQFPVQDAEIALRDAETAAAGEQC